jgi:hypothetical protein
MGKTFSPGAFLFHTLHIVRGRQATDPRDKIYGMRELVADESVGQLKPDYNMAVEDLHARLALSIIRDTQNLKIFEYIPPEPRILGVPSWAPDWSISLDPTFDLMGSGRAFNNTM